MNTSYQRVVVGGGINGLCTAWALLKRGIKKIALIDSNTIGGTHGSSHGNSRITRSAYSDSLYVKLMQDSHNRYWPLLEHDLNLELSIPNSGLIWGPRTGVFGQYSKAVIAAGAAVEELNIDIARKRFPQFVFHENDGVLEDHTAGILASHRTIMGLRHYLSEHGVDVIECCQVHSIDPTPTDVRLSTNRGFISTAHVIICAGPWASELLPFLKSRVNVVLQKVFYWQLKDEKKERPGTFPVWVSLGHDASECFYGLPRFGRPGIKIAQHKLLGSDSPDTDVWIEDDDIVQMKEQLRQFISLPLGELSGWESCRYTVTENEDFILDRHPEDERIVIGAGFSGHGFKFGPITGYALAALCETGSFVHPEMQAHKTRFSI